MRTLSFAFFWVFMLTGSIVNGQQPESTAKQALAELNRFKGSWEKKWTIYKSEWSSEELKRTGTQTDTWILADSHLQEMGQDSDGMNYMTVYSYDVAAKAYHASLFQSNGNTSKMLGQWDPQSSAFTWTHDLGDGIRMIGTYKFVTPDQFKFSYIAKGKENKELFRLEGIGSRRDGKK